MDKENSSGGGWRQNASSSVVRELWPPAFLSKTYTIVDDPSTNSIISWGEFGNSFIIWDHLKFTEQILPNYFRHSNLSSFVYQLNNYGFRKIGCDHQWEYQNQDFQKGKMHLLANMKRRGQTPGYVARKRAVPHSMIAEKLTKEVEESKLEIKKLKSQQVEMELHFMAMEDLVKNAECKTKKLMAYWAKACEKIIADKMSAEIGNEKAYEDFGGKNNQDQEEMVKQDDKSIPSSDQNQPVSSTNVNCEATPEKNSGDYAFWNNIIFLGDDEGVAYEGEARAKIERDFEDLITKKLDNPEH